MSKTTRLTLKTVHPALTRRKPHTTRRCFRNGPPDQYTTTSLHDASIPAPQALPSALAALPPAALLRSLLINGISSRPWLLSPAIALLLKVCQPQPSLLFDVSRNPVLAWLLKQTVYKQFCAGETAGEIQRTMRAMKDMGFRGTILTYAKETVFDHNKQTEMGLGMESDAGDKVASGECAHIESWRQGTLETVRLLGEGDQLAVK